MNKKIIGILSAVTLIGGAVYLSGQGGLGGLSSSVLGGDACTQAGLDAQKAQYEGSSDQIASLEEQMSSLEDSISSAEESIATYQARVAEKKQEIKNTNQEVNQLENYIKSQCDIKKQSRGWQVNYSAPDCNPKKNQVANKKQQINNLEKSVNEILSTIQTAQRNIQNQTSSLQQLENSIAEIEEFVEEYDACEMTLASGSGGDVELEEDNEVIDDENDTSTTIPTATPTTSTPTVSEPTTPTTNSGATPLTMETNTPTDLIQFLRFENYYSWDYKDFANNQSLLGIDYDTNTDATSVQYGSISINTDIEAANNNINMSISALKKQQKELKIAEKNLRKAKTNKDKKELQKTIKELKEWIETNSNNLAASWLNQVWLKKLLALKQQVLANPKIVATNSHTAHSVTQSGNAGNQIELYRFTLQTDLPPVSVVDQIVFEIHSSSSSVSFVDGSLLLVEKSSLKPVLNCSQKQTTKRIIHCLPLQCTNQNRDCNPVLRDNTPHEYVLVGKLQNTTTGSYAINKIDGIIYNTFTLRYFNSDIINNTRPFQTIFTAGQ